MAKPPLSGITVLDLSTILAGPLTSSLLAEFGADVIKVEQPGTGDPARSYPPLDDGASAQWSMLGRNKRSVTVDLHREGAAGVIGRLVAATDIVVTNFRPATLRRFGERALHPLDGPEQVHGRRTRGGHHVAGLLELDRELSGAPRGALPRAQRDPHRGRHAERHDPVGAHHGRGSTIAASCLDLSSRSN